ncbi:MAG: ParB N-terminal domain-containing protein, partial [Verrucomicrobiota bacterium]
RAVVVKPKVLIGDESEKTFSVPKNSGTGKKPGQVVHNQGGDVKKTSHKNAAQVALTSVGVEEPGQTTAEAVDALSENSETAAGATAAVSKANANDQAHDAAQTVGAAERVGNNIPQGKICVVDVAGLELNPLSETLYGADAPEPLKTSIEEEGVTSPLIIARCSGKVLSGNTRLKIAREVGVEKVPVVYIEGQLTEEEETNLVITCNIERAKTREMKTLEYRELLRIEKGLAIRRRARKSADGDKVPNLEPGKSRDKAAAKIGVSASSLDTGLKVIEAMEKLRRKGDPEGAEVLRTKLNDEGFSSALNCASDNGWHMENGDAAQAGEGAGVQANEKARDPKGEVAVVKAGGGKKAAKVAVKPVDQKPPPELSQDEKDALKSAEEHIAGLEEYLHKKTIDRLSEAAKADLGRAMGRLNTAAVLAGINVIVD